MRGNDCFEIDTRLVIKASQRSSHSYRQFSEVADTVADRLLERLPLLGMKPARILDLGTGDGRNLATLKKLYPSALIVGADICQSSLLINRQNQSLFSKIAGKSPVLVCLDAMRQQPFAAESFDLIVSNLLLPWVHPSEVFAAELNRLLATDGAFFLSSVGPDTLIELRRAWEKIDTAEHINAFLDMHDLGDVLDRAGITDTVMDTERLQVSFTSVHKLLEDLAGTGCTNVLTGRRKGLTSASVRDQLAGHYVSAAVMEDDKESIYATLEVVYAHGWKGKPRLPHGQQIVSLDDLRQNLTQENS
ncbi:hypothetical protein AB833_30040 [Chromatiales bacterium (ex Bugula neritina AB1)]|nr:hypothetical protein AB833_30040 [Chromatiales bacterium (ex Bugula neritina AB1)]